ncbi:MAG: SusF/SusE family outer membrane protein, partial [Candidatus Azobacteroides sp.]|nr:SusF/SusE family outer membrane protein [Candidatus Azobacteroides sp.]
ISTSGGNLSVSETGFYRLTVDLSKEPYTYTATATEWGLIGSATAGGWDTSTPMTLNPATGEWTVTATLVGGGDNAFKFRANNGWDINLGGNANNLTYNGDNIPVASDGAYLITLKLGDASAYTYTIVKQ